MAGMPRLTVVFVFLLLSCTSCLSHEEWEDWKQLYEKKYVDDEEELNRFWIWDYNRQYIDDHNSLGKSYSLKINEFADLVRTGK